MEKLICSSCGSNDFKDEGRFLTCNYCGTKYKKGATDYEPASIDKTDALTALLDRANLYWQIGNKAKAKNLYRIALEQNPYCEIAKQRIK